VGVGPGTGIILPGRGTGTVVEVEKKPIICGNIDRYFLFDFIFMTKKGKHKTPNTKRTD
jgi:hypothetical protein